MKIDYAGKRKLSQSNDLPDMTPGIEMFFQKITIEIVIKHNHKGILEEETSTHRTMGVRISQTGQQLAMHPEGQRNWKYSNLFMLPEPKLRVDDVVRIQGVKYRVMNRKNNSEYSCVEYELLEDYENEE